MARTKQTARKWTGGTAPRVPLPSRKHVKAKVTNKSTHDTAYLPADVSGKLRTKILRLPDWVHHWIIRAHETVAGVWTQAASARELWRFVYKMAKKHEGGEKALWSNLSTVMTSISQLDLTEITSASQLIAGVQNYRPILARLLLEHEREAVGSLDPCVAYGTVGFSSALTHALRKFGYCRVTGVIDAGRAASLRASMLAWQASLPAGTKVPPHGIYKHHYVGHQDFAWAIRGEPGVRQVFASVWGIEDWKSGMVTSLDGSCIVPSGFSRRDRAWTHVDQAPKSRGRQCYQGLVSLTSNETRTLVVHKFTHRVHSRYFEHRSMGSVSKKFMPVDQADMACISHLRTRVAVNAGDMILWDSRLMHENEVGGLSPEDRCVQYVCMLPRAHPGNTEAQHRKRLECVQQRRTTSHWPVGITKNSMQPQVYGDKSKLIDYGGAVQMPVFSSRTLDIISELV